MRAFTVIDDDTLITDSNRIGGDQPIRDGIEVTANSYGGHVIELAPPQGKERHEFSLDDEMHIERRDGGYGKPVILGASMERADRGSTGFINPKPGEENLALILLSVEWSLRGEQTKVEILKPTLTQILDTAEDRYKHRRNYLLVMELGSQIQLTRKTRMLRGPVITLVWDGERPALQSMPKQRYTTSPLPAGSATRSEDNISTEILPTDDEGEE